MLQFLRRRAADDDQTATPAIVARSERPTIGLALGGGAARGFAHIGVIRVLVENGFKPDVIAGTSIGAVAGATYAAGRLDSFEAWGRALNRRRMFGYFDFNFAGSGLISGSRIAEAMQRELGDIAIGDLPVRFAAIATEVGTGHEIWLTRGRVIDALRASYALPGIFPPIRIGGRWLMDGALVNPVPVSAARALGARLVIGVNLNADLFGRGTTIHEHGPEASGGAHSAIADGGDSDASVLRERRCGEISRPGLSAVMVDAFNIVLDRITRARLAGDPPDALISPRLGRVGLMDFHRADDAIALGEEAARKALDSVSEAMAALA